jgi:ABC-type transporter Mla maintaining outer membrane lipid asymmetry permease subunit MlaE
MRSHSEAAGVVAKSVELTAQIGGSVADALSYVGALASLGGRAAYFTFVAPFQGKGLSLKRSVSQAMQVGVRALPILSLITFFIGLILALQSAYELERFGALHYVAGAVAISMTRELGPLITAIVVIGRSGSAFAAELGTMKVTEEIDALETMAIDPVRFLVTPFLAMMVMLPCLMIANTRGFSGAPFGVARRFPARRIHLRLCRCSPPARHRFRTHQERHVRSDHGGRMSRRLSTGAGEQVGRSTTCRGVSFSGDPVDLAS